MPKTWLITGSASGIGRNTAELVLARGDNLVATARDVNRLLDLAAATASRSPSLSSM